jgi:putative alpha-1,2-mannosidase
MGSWYVLSTLGLFPVAGSDLWLLGAPRFPQARVNVGGHELVIERQGSGIHVASATLDGAAISGSITHAQLVGASKLVFTMTE